VRFDDLRNVQNSSASDGQEPEYDLLSVSDIVSFFKHFWPLIATSAFICTVLGLLYIFSATPKYTAIAQLLIETNRSAAPAIALPEAVVTLDTPQIESEIALLTSEQIVKRAAKALDQANAPQAGSGKDAAPSKANGGSALGAGGGLSRLLFGNSTSDSPASDDETLGEQMKEIQSNLSVKRVGLSYVLELSYNAKNPKLAAEVVNALADAYVQDKIDGRAESARRSGLWLEARIEEIRRLMNEAALDVQEFKARRDYRLADRPTPNNRDLGLDFLPKPSNGAAPPATADSKPAAPKNDGNTVSAQDAPTLEELDSRALTYRKIYESYLQAYTDTVQRQSFPGTASRVIARAEPPKRQSSPKRGLILLGSLVAGALIGVGIALVRTVADETVRSSNQLIRKIGVPLLGEIDNTLWTTRVPFVGKILKATRRRHGNNLTVLREPNSITARQLVMTAAKINTAAHAMGTPVVGVIGISKKVDAGAICSNIALLNARTGRKTLLVEAAPGPGNLTATFAGGNQARLKEVIDDGLNWSDAILQSREERSLSLLLLSNTETHAYWTPERVDKLRSVIREMQGRFDNIFVHLPSTSGDDLTSRAVDSALVVSEMWTTRLSELSEAAARLRIAEQPLLGVVAATFA
jgi:uncharacterized protein involved in exopolysaccharide biosynthesis/Mrp family chromosome partitioning ATPase